MLTIFQNTTMFTNVLLCLRMYFCNSILLRIRLYIYAYIYYIQVHGTIHFVTFSICSAYFCRETYMLLFSILSPMFFLYILNHSLLSFSIFRKDIVFTIFVIAIIFSMLNTLNPWCSLRRPKYIITHFRSQIRLIP